MTTKPIQCESRMLEEVRRWRREAYEADQVRSPEDRRHMLDALLQQFGLTPEQHEAHPRPDLPRR